MDRATVEKIIAAVGLDGLGFVVWFKSIGEKSLTQQAMAQSLGISHVTLRKLMRRCKDAGLLVERKSAVAVVAQVVPQAIETPVIEPVVQEPIAETIVDPPQVIELSTDPLPLAPPDPQLSLFDNPPPPDVAKLPRKRKSKEVDVALPEELQGDEFCREWTRWLKFLRGEKGQHVGKSTQNVMLEKLAKFPEKVCVWAIRHSIEKGWSSLWPESYGREQNGNGKYNSRNPAENRGRFRG